MSTTPVDIAKMLDGKDANDMAEVPDEIRGKTPVELQDILTVLDAQLRSIHQEDDGVLRVKTAGERTAFAYGVRLRDKIIERIEEHRSVAEVFERRPAAVKRAMTNISYGLEDPGAGIRRMTVPEARDLALRELDKRETTMHLRPDQLEHVERQVRRNTDIARRLIVTETEHYRTAWQKLVTNPNAAMSLSEDERHAIQAWEEYRAMSEGTTSAGGFGIPVFIDPSIILTAQGSGNPFLQIARQVQVNTNAWKGVSSAGVSWSFDAESSAVSDDSPTLAQPSVSVFMARGFIPYSIELGQDYPGFADEMAMLLGEGYDELLVDKFSRGTGSGEPLGIITALDADTTDEVRLTTAGALGEVDIYKVWAALPQRFRTNASWMMSVGVNNAIRRMGTAQVYHASTINLQQEWIDRLMNRRVFESTYFPDVVATTGPTNQIVVGDFNNYILARRGGMSVELVPTLFDVTNNRPTGQRGWFAYARIGGGLASSQGFRLLNQT